MRPASAVAAAAIRFRHYLKSQVVGHADAAAAWEWRKLNSLANLFLGFAERARDVNSWQRLWSLAGSFIKKPK